MSERVLQILIQAFPKILIPCIKVTIPLTICSFILGLILALFLAIVQIANIRGLKQFARFYIWIFRGTPLLVQLFIVFFWFAVPGDHVGRFSVSGDCIFLESGCL